MTPAASAKARCWVKAPSEPPSSAAAGGVFRCSCLSPRSGRVLRRPPDASSAGESAAKRMTGEAGVASLPTFLATQESRPPAGRRRGFAKHRFAPPQPAGCANPAVDRDPANVRSNNGKPLVSISAGNGKPLVSTSQQQASSLRPGPSPVRPAPSSLRPGPSPVRPAPSSLRPGPSSVRPAPSSLRPGPSSVRPAPSSLRPDPSSVRPSPSSLQPASGPAVSVSAGRGGGGGRRGCGGPGCCRA